MGKRVLLWKEAVASARGDSWNSWRQTAKTPLLLTLSLSLYFSSLSLSHFLSCCVLIANPVDSGALKTKGFACHKGEITCMAAGPGHKYMVTGGVDFTVKVRRKRRGRENEEKRSRREEDSRGIQGSVCPSLRGPNA